MRTCEFRLPHLFQGDVWAFVPLFDLTHSNWQSLSPTFYSTCYNISQLFPDFASQKVSFGPYDHRDEDGGVKAAIMNGDEVEMLKSCPATHRSLQTDLSFTIQRDNSASQSVITYLR